MIRTGPLQIRDRLQGAAILLVRVLRERPSRAIPLLALLLLAPLAGIYCAAPYSAVRSLRAAVRAQDGTGVANALDLERVRESLQLQLDRMLAQAEASAPAPGTGRVVIGRAGPSMAHALAGPLVERVLTPEGMASFLELDGEPARQLLRIANGPPPPGLAAAPAASAAPQSGAPWIERVESMGFRTPLRFEVQLEGGWIVYLAPYGLRWKVYDVALPSGLFAS